jgi:membrane associated rhomboid family serine protease
MGYLVFSKSCSDEISCYEKSPMLGPYPDALSEWGGKNAPLIVEDGEWWRLVTPILLHAGLFHLVGNVAVQLEMGILFEKEWGTIRWLIIYIGSGAGSSILSVIFMPQAVSVGSSGAVMGLFGAKLAEIVLRVCERDDTVQSRVAHKVRKEQCCAVTCSVIVVLLFSFVPYVDWAAHVGGLLAGLAMGFMIFSLELEYCFWQLFWLLIGFALTFAGFMASLTHMYSGEIEIIEQLRDVCGYYTTTFADYECNCMRSEYFSNMNNGNAAA